MLICNEDVLKMDGVLVMDVQEALFYLSYMVKKNREQEARYKKQKI